MPKLLFVAHKRAHCSSAVPFGRLYLKGMQGFSALLTVLPLAIVVALFFATAIVPTQVSAQAVVFSNVNLDGSPSKAIVARSADGQLRAGRLINNQFQYTALTDPGLNFRLLAAVDLNKNGKADLIFQDMTQGEFGDVKVWSDFQPSMQYTLRQVKRVWDVQAHGDLDGDGFGDLVWRYTVQNSPDTGVSYIWFTDAATVTKVRKRGGAPLDWTLLGAADLNADGAMDMLYISPGNQLRVLMGTANRTCANLSAGVIQDGFTALKFGDFTGNGRGDVLVRHNATGVVQLLSLSAMGLTLPDYAGAPDDQNASCTSTTLGITNTARFLPITPTTAKFYAAGDFNGDGIADIVWLQADGTLTVWLMQPNGAAPIVIANAGTGPFVPGATPPPPPPPPPTNQPPTVLLTSPANGSSSAVGTAISIAATATDADGTIAKVEFFAGTNKLGEKTTAPYVYAWTNTAAGTYAITAKATDNAGATATSAATTIIVTAVLVPPPPANPAPTVSLTSPANSATFTVGTTINIAANAADVNGTVAKVEFFAGNTKLGEKVTAPYTYAWTNSAVGGYSLTAKATDNLGAATTSTAVNVAVTAVGVPPPVTGSGTGLLAEYFTNVDLTAPSAVVRVDSTVDFAWLDATIPAPGIGASNFSVRWTGEVVAPVTGAVTFSTSSDDGVRLWVNNQRLVNNWTGHGATIDTGAPIQMVSGQRYPIRLEYFQGGGGKEIKLRWAHASNSSTAQAVPMSNLIPATTADFTIAVGLAAQSPDSFTAPSMINLTAIPVVSGSGKPIAKVEFFQIITQAGVQSAVKLGEATAAPWVYAWTNVAVGAYTIAALATDSVGITGSSPSVSFTIATAPLSVSAATMDAARLLEQTTFGATRSEINRVAGIGVDAYLAEQFNAPQTLHLDTVRNDPRYPKEPYAVMMPSIWRQYFEANDQLRQRVVSALSQIVVISLQNNTIGDQSCGPAAYLDIIGRNAFGNYRDILKQVTMSPAMGEYLNMKGSAKADPVLKSIPSENYARELLQLFSIGTVMLNLDGSVQFSAGKPIETYSEATAQEFARALTGWHFAGQDQTKTWRWLYPDVPYPSDAASGAKACAAWSLPMQPWRATYRASDDKRDIAGGAHDTGAKSLLTYPGSTNFKQSIPANQAPEQDLDDVIENVFNHPNVGPHISELLIQRLITSNPTGAYVARVASVFNNNGAGVRGDLKAVVKAILTDADARKPLASQSSSFGKLREPIIRFTQFHRAFGATMAGGVYANIYDLGDSTELAQSPLNAPSVFNFYHPDFSATGPLARASLVGPEFEITNSATIAGFMDFSKYGIVGGFNSYDATKWLKPNYDAYLAMANTPATMVDELNVLLMAGSMSPQFRTQLIDVATKLTDSNATTQSMERLKLVLWLILNSPEYSIQK